MFDDPRTLDAMIDEVVAGAEREYGSVSYKTCWMWIENFCFLSPEETQFILKEIERRRNGIFC